MLNFFKINKLFLQKQSFALYNLKVVIMKELLEKLENLPSILNIEYELFFIDRLQTLPIDEISKNKEEI